MKTRIITIIAALLAVATGNAIVTPPTASRTVEFSLDDYTLRYDDKGLLHIEPNDLDHFYGEDNAPALPFTSTVVALAGAYTYKSHIPMCPKRLIASDVVLASNPMPVPTSMADMAVADDNADYPSATYPDSSCKFATSSGWDRETLFYFRLCPFVYNAATRELYFVDRITFSVWTNDGSNNEVSLPHVPEHIQQLYPVQSQIGVRTLSSVKESKDDVIDYLIVTNQNLKSAFKPLLDWKTIKGLRTKIITVEEIADLYDSGDIQLKIKQYLYDLYYNNSLKYVLLGGDDGIVPVRGSYGWANTVSGIREDSSIPTDLYYACFGDSFDWDANQNGIYGETTDKINLAQSIYISRCPVASPTDVTNFTSKLVTYERNPKWLGKMLLCGKQLSNLGDSERISSYMYEQYIAKHWGYDCFKFFDSSTSFPLGKNYDFTASNLVDQINSGYTFIDVNTHGSQTSWQMESGPSYNCAHAKSQTNKTYSIITTSACNSNAFDLSSKAGKSDPCLSEALIRGEQSGIIAFLGSSRYGWYYINSNTGPSTQYSGKFYEKLLSPSITQKNFGTIVSLAKQAMINSSLYDGYMRWLQFSLNPIGDPEMPIYISKPLSFDNVSISSIGMTLKIDTGEDKCKVSIVELDKEGSPIIHSIYEDVKLIETNTFPEECIICISKNGYTPHIATVRCLQNEVLNGTNEINATIVLMGSMVNSLYSGGDVFLGNCFLKINADQTIIRPNIIIGENATIGITF